MYSRFKPLTLLLLYGLSGVTALAYEVLWTRMLALLFGVSILGVVVTVAAFMLGLGLGSFLAVRQGMSFKRVWQVVIVVEFSVAVYALSLPFIMQTLQGLWLSVESIAVWQFWQISAALLVLSLPAMALGFAFPCILRIGKAFKLSLAKLYGINTLGGALGALLPLLLLPWLGWAMALTSVAALGMLIALGLLYLSRTHDISNPSEQEQGAKYPSLNIRMLLAYAGMGAGALMLEIAWTRAYGMILLRTEYVLAVILAVFLIGIGLGSLLFRYINREWALKWLPIGMLFTGLIALYAFPYINTWHHNCAASSLSEALWFDAGLIALCTLPLTLSLGVWLPLIGKGDSGGALYAVNSLGACLGALLAGFVFIPWLGTAITWLLGIGFIVVCACYWQPKYKQGFALLSLCLLILLGWPVRQLPDASNLLKHELGHAKDIYQFEDAVSITHVVERDDGQHVLLADLQRMDAASDATSVEVQKNQARLPLFLHGSAKRVLFLGLGTGITVSGAFAWNDLDIQSVELSQGAIQASARYFNQVNRDVAKHVKIYHDDARRFLMRNQDFYDVIVGDLFHPDMVGRGALLSVEQFERAKRRLNHHGVFAQWLAFNQFDIASLQVILHSFYQVFPHNAIFVDGYRMALVGFHDDMQSASFLEHAAPSIDAWGGEGAWTWIGRYWGDISALTTHTGKLPIQSEWSPVIEYSLPHMRYADAALPEVLLWMIKQRISFKQAKQRWQVTDAEQNAFKRAWAASSLNMRAQYLALKGSPERVRFQQLAYKANPKDRWAGFGLADAMFDSLQQALPKGMSYEQALTKVLSIRADHENALKALMKLKYKQGDIKAAKKYANKLHAISPYARLER